MRLQRLSPRTITADRLVFHLEWWARGHGRTINVCEGSTYRASISGLTGYVAGLRQLFVSVGRAGASAGRGHRPDSLYLSNGPGQIELGNPADSPQVSDFVATYGQRLFNQGIDAKAAVPLGTGE